MAVAGVVVLGSLAAIGDWGPCCNLAKPITGDPTWVRPPNPWLFGGAVIPGLATKSGHKAKSTNGGSGADTNPLARLASVKPHGKRNRPSPPNAVNPIGGNSQSETPLPPGVPGRTPGNTTSTDTCSPVLGVLTGLASAGCAESAGPPDHNDSSGDHGSSSNGNHHSSHHHGRSHDTTALAKQNSHPPDKGGKGHGSDKGKKAHGAKSEGKRHGKGRSGGSKHD